MAVDEGLSQRFRAATDHLSGVSEKRMMGGVCFLLNGNMLGGADRTKEGEGRFMFRVGKDNEAQALARNGAIVMEQGGRRMGGLIFVSEEVCDKNSLRDWIELALEFVSALPAK